MNTFSLVLLSALLVKSQDANFATPMLLNVREMSDAAEIGDEEHRGPKWRDLSTDTSNASDEDTSKTDTSSSLQYTDGRSETESSTSSEGSSVFTKEKNKGKKKKRECKGCPKDMLKSWKNINIRWICAGYQRARRSFKSLCMMRYRNCQDGTIKLVFSDVVNLTTSSDHPQLSHPTLAENINSTISRYYSARADSVFAYEVKSTTSGYAQLINLTVTENINKTFRRLGDGKNYVDGRKRGRERDSGSFVVPSSSGDDGSFKGRKYKKDKGGKKYGQDRKNRKRHRDKKKKRSSEESSDSTSLDTSTDSPTDSSDETSSSSNSISKRDCGKCPEANLNWKDHRILWICGAYQRARRTFKSVCMMRYRNCQDGTMFVKISDQRCKNDTKEKGAPIHGNHWFYDYKGKDIFEGSSSESDSSETVSLSDSDEYKVWRSIEYLYP